MKTKIIALSLIALTVLSAIPAIALAVPKPVSTYTNPKGKPYGPAGKSHIGRLYLVEKYPCTAGDTNPICWTIVKDGAWGKLKFSTRNNKFVFNGHELTPDTSYTLIYYGALVDSVWHNDEWPYATCLGNGVANGDGDVHIRGRFEYFDEFIDDGKDCETSPETCQKFWLVLSDDINCDASAMTPWNPTEYLFEYDIV